MTLAHFVSDLADQALILPLTAVVAGVLLLGGRSRLALAWLGVVGSVFAAMLLMKLSLSICEPLIPRALHSPSGHTAAAAVVYGGLLRISAEPTAQRDSLALLLGLAITIAVGTSRVWLGAHTALEVVLGGAIGFAGVLLFARTARASLGAGTVSLLLAGMAIVALATHGAHLPAERWIGAIAHLLRAKFSICTG